MRPRFNISQSCKVYQGNTREARLGVRRTRRRFHSGGCAAWFLDGAKRKAMTSHRTPKATRRHFHSGGCARRGFGRGQKESDDKSSHSKGDSSPLSLWRLREGQSEFQVDRMTSRRRMQTWHGRIQAAMIRRTRSNRAEVSYRQSSAVSAFSHGGSNGQINVSCETCHCRFEGVATEVSSSA